ncbi:MAG: FHA domain-containing protein [Pseudomonadota bacterium]
MAKESACNDGDRSFVMAKKKAATRKTHDDSLRGTQIEASVGAPDDVPDQGQEPVVDDMDVGDDLAAEEAKLETSDAEADEEDGDQDAGDEPEDGEDSGDDDPEGVKDEDDEGGEGDEDEASEESEEPDDPDAALKVDVVLVQSIESIVERRAHVLELIENTRDRARAVKPDIFERVIGDYQRQLAEVEAEYEPASEAICQSLMAISALEDKLRDETEQINDRMVEMRFRCEVGEFPEEDLFPIEDEHQRQLKHLNARMALIDETYSQCKPFLRAEDFEEATGRPYEDKPEEDVAEEPAAALAEDPDGESGDLGDLEIDEFDAPGVRVTAPPEVFTAASRLDDVRRVAEEADDDGLPTRFEQRPEDSLSEGASEERTIAGGQLKCYVVHKLADGSERDYPLGLEPFAIGRHPQNDLVLADRGISRRHARVVLENTGRYTVSDLSSGNGVFVNGTRVHGKFKLTSGDTITMGSSTMDYLERLE